MSLSTYVALFALAWWAVIWLICLLGYSVACVRCILPTSQLLRLFTDSKKRYASAKPSKYEPPLLSIPDEKVPGVSILRPLRGLDCNLYENLESSFQSKYPSARFEIICSVAEEDDQAIEVVKSLIERYPQVDARIIVGEEVVGVNPKINNLVRSYAAAKHDIVWIIDSNVQISPGAIGRAVEMFEKPSSKPIGLVHHVPFPAYPDINLGSRVEQAFLSTTHAKMYLALNATQLDSCVCGKSSLFRKSDLERSTRRHAETNKGKSTVEQAMSQLQEKDKYGIAAFHEYLGEDNMIGSFIWHDLGMRHAIAPDVAANVVGNMTFEKYFWRRVRWIRVRKYMVMASTILEPLTESLACAFFGAYALKHLLRIPVLLFFPLHMIAWYLIDVSVFRSLSRASPAQPLHNPWHDGPGPSRFRPSFIAAWLTRELFAFPIWAFAMLGSKVSWREEGKVYRVRSDGKVIEISSEEKEDWIDQAGKEAFVRFRGHGARRFEPLPQEDRSQP